MDPCRKVQNPASSSTALTALIFASLFRGSWSQNSDYNWTVPASVSVQRGLCVHIPCSFTYNQGDRPSRWKLYGYWFQNKDGYQHHFLPGYFRTVPGILVATNGERQELMTSVEHRFQLTGEPEEGDCSFSILNAKPEDEGEYYFRIEDDLRFRYSPHYSKTHRLLQVLVTEFTEKPQIWASSEVFSGEEAVYTCSAPGPCIETEPTISWETILTGYRTSQWSQQHTNGSWTYGSNFTFTPSVNDQGKRLTCQVWYPNISTQVANTIFLDILGPPKTVEISTNATDHEHLAPHKEVLGSSSATLFLIILCLIKVLFCFLFFFSVFWFSNRRKAPLREKQCKMRMT